MGRLMRKVEGSLLGNQHLLQAEPGEVCRTSTRDERLLGFQESKLAVGRLEPW